MGRNTSLPPRKQSLSHISRGSGVFPTSWSLYSPPPNSSTSPSWIPGMKELNLAQQMGWGVGGGAPWPSFGAFWLVAARLGGIYIKIFYISHLIINILVTKTKCPGCCLVCSWEGFQEEVGEGVGELWRRVLGSDEQEGEENIGGGRGEGMVGTPGKQGCCGEEALEGDGRGESPVLSAFIFSNKEKHIPLRLVWITCWLGADLQTEPQQEDATLGSGRTAWGGGNMAPARRVGGGGS